MTSIVSSVLKFRGFAFAAALLCLLYGSATSQAQGLGRGSIPASSGGRSGLGVGSYDTKERPTPPRVVSGTVLDKNGTAVKGALVFLQDDKTSATKSVTADDKGKFRFVQISRTVDYKLWAQAKDGKSTQKTISQFDTQSEIERNLKIE